jgi:hypothetical protein
VPAPSRIFGPRILHSRRGWGGRAPYTEYTQCRGWGVANPNTFHRHTAERNTFTYNELISSYFLLLCVCVVGGARPDVSWWRPAWGMGGGGGPSHTHTTEYLEVGGRGLSCEAENSPFEAATCVHRTEFSRDDGKITTKPR